jgi:hypothetical protein
MSGIPLLGRYYFLENYMVLFNLSLFSLRLSIEVNQLWDLYQVIKAIAVAINHVGMGRDPTRIGLFHEIESAAFICSHRYN